MNFVVRLYRQSLKFFNFVGRSRRNVRHVFGGKMSMVIDGRSSCLRTMKLDEESEGRVRVRYQICIRGTSQQPR